MSGLPQRRAAARIAWRQARRAPGRTALIVALVALPVAGLSVIVTGIHTVMPTAEERAVERMGSADLVIDEWFDEPDQEALRAALPEGGRMVVGLAGFTQSVVNGAVLGVVIDEFSVPIDREPVRGLYRIVDGRAPRSGEIALHPSTIEDIRVAVGDRLLLESHGITVRITGAVVLPGSLAEPTAVTGPGTLPAGPEIMPHRVLFDLPPGADVGATKDALSAVPGVGFVLTRADVAEGDERAKLVANAAALGGGALVLFGTGLIAAAAFAVGARRQLRTLGLVSAAGGEPKQVRSVVLLGGSVLGLAGSLIGLVLGIAVSSSLHPSFLSSLADREVGPLEFPIPWLIGGLVLGTLASTVAAYGPARSAARLSTVESLAGRGRPPRPPGRLARRGLVVFAAGAAATAFGTTQRSVTIMTISLVTMLSGLLLAIPLLTSVTGRVAGHLPAIPRIAAREVSRHGRRTGAALAAATMVLALPVGVSAATLSEEASVSQVPWMAEDHLTLTYGLATEDRDARRAAFVSSLRAAFPGAIVEPLRQAYFVDAPVVHAGAEPWLAWIEGPERISEDGRSAFREGGPLLIGGPELLRALHAEDGIPALRAGSVVAIGPDTVEGDSLRLMLPSEDEGPQRTRALPAVSAGPTHYAGLGMGGELNYVISPDAAAAIGLERYDPPDYAVWLLRSAQPLDADDVERAKTIAAQEPGAFVSARSDFESNGAPFRLILTIAATLAALAIVCVVVALVASESRRDHAILVAVGAEPALRRRVIGTNAWMIGTLGALLAIPAGLAPVVVVQLSRAAARTIVVPWTTIGVALLALPLAAALLAAAVSRQPKATQLLRPIA